MPYGLIFSSGTWNVRVTVPQNVLHVFGRTVLWRTLQTRDYADAKRAAPPIHALFKRQIADARQKLIRPDASSEAVVGALHKAAMVPPSKWSAVKDAPLDTVRPPWQVQSAMAAFRRARDEPDGWKAIPEFDQRVVNILAQDDDASGCPGRGDSEDRCPPPSRGPARGELRSRVDPRRSGRREAAA